MIQPDDDLERDTKDRLEQAIHQLIRDVSAEIEKPTSNATRQALHRQLVNAEHTTVKAINGVSDILSSLSPCGRGSLRRTC